MRSLWWSASALCVALGTGCRLDMHDQPRYEPLEASDFFDDGRASRLPIDGTVARGELFEDDHFYRGRIDGELAATLPMPLNEAVLRRGQSRYQIFCVPCHDQSGSGNGMVVQRGFRVPPSFHTERLRQAPLAHFFDVMTRGFGTMASYAERLTPHDRWCIAAYVRTLQYSQFAPVADLRAEERARLPEVPR